MISQFIIFRKPIKYWVVVMKKSWVFLKQTQPKIIINQSMLMSVEVERIEENQKINEKFKKIIRRQHN